MTLDQHIISHTATVRQALDDLNDLSGTKLMTLFVTDSEGRVTGSVTDGDIRRAMLAGHSLDAPVTEAMQRRFRSVTAPAASPGNVQFFKTLRGRGITLVPVLDDYGRPVDLVDLRATRTRLPLGAVLMAGGKGERLRPQTLKTPKPLLKIEGKAIIDYNIDALLACGISDITVTTRYLADQIYDHFADPINGVRVRCVTEDQPLGTIGAVGLCNVPAEGNTLIMNSDIITTISFEDMFLRHIQEEADVTIAVTPYQISVPFAILDTDGTRVTGLEEKPTFSYLINAGIYIFSNQVLARLDGHTHKDAPDLAAEVIAEGGKVVYSPIDGTWIDVGSPADFVQASLLMRHHHNLSAIR